jgi:hypothetical protein
LRYRPKQEALARPGRYRDAPSLGESFAHGLTQPGKDLGNFVLEKSQVPAIIVQQLAGGDALGALDTYADAVGNNLSIVGQSLLSLNPLGVMYHSLEGGWNLVDNVAHGRWNAVAESAGNKAFEGLSTIASEGVSTTLGKMSGRLMPRGQVRGARGPASGRPFDPAQAGGPIRNLSTSKVRITPKGIDAVEKHLSRFGPDDANAGMTARLRRIAAGEMQATSSDMNFYTHELRESVRYRNLGHPSGDPGYDVWNNAHTATLEDYGLKEGPGVLYHPSVSE